MVVQVEAQIHNAIMEVKQAQLLSKNIEIEKEPALSFPISDLVEQLQGSVAMSGTSHLV